MRGHISVLAVLGVVLASACSSSSGGTTSGGTSGGTTTGGTTTGGTSGGTLAAGSPCTVNSQCVSGVCDVGGSGHCCTAACSTTDPTCKATACDASGACSYPANTTSCGTDQCNNGAIAKSRCDGSGTCLAGSPGACPGNLVCADPTACLTTCHLSVDCVSGYYCDPNSNRCLATQATGACTTNEACTSGFCGVSGTGNCCTAQCSATTDPACNATSCDVGTGACVFPSGAACGTPSCTGNELSTGACAATGACNLSSAACTGNLVCNAGGTGCLTTCAANTDCVAGYYCSAAQCVWQVTTCTSSTDCVSGGFCDTANSVCCQALKSGDSIAVDGTTGNDSTSCCGVGSNGACQTLTRAMAVILASGTQNVTINATVNGGGGDWTAQETYPVVLSSGAELSAPGVFFLDPTFNPANAETFDISGSASIVGTTQSPVHVGFDSAGKQSADSSAIAVEANGALYLANASVNGSQFNYSQAIDVFGGATLMLGQDQSGGVTGTVTIGNSLGAHATDGFAGIWCEADLTNKLGCTVKDAALIGQSSVVIQGQEKLAIRATDYSVISLTSAPVIGVPPSAPGFLNCPSKLDGSGTSYLAEIEIEGSANVTFKNGVVQCLFGTAFELVDSGNYVGSPTLTVDKTVIQNTEFGVLATMGTATFTNTTFNYNYSGVVQGEGFNGNGIIDLSGGGNTVICSSSKESAQGGTIGIDVYNSSTKNLKADNVAWDTAGPDYFDCDSPITSCTCNIAACTNKPNSDDMDAVEDTTYSGGITTTGNTQSSSACN